jgi:hypothetical protein
VHDVLVTCAPVVSQYAAIAALEFGGPFIEQFREEFRRRRQRMIERLDALPEVFDYQKPNASYFAFPRVKDTVPLARDSRALADDILDRARVALVPGVAFGPTGEAHLRFCYARELADIDRALDRLTDYFAGRAPRTYALPTSPVRRRRDGPSRAIGVQVLHFLARVSLARSRPRVIAIAGGRGKTVLKRTLAELLSAQLRVRSNPLSYNTDVGLAFAILDTAFDSRRLLSVAAGVGRALWHALFPAGVDVLVLELGARQRNDIRRLLRVVQPDVAVVTPLAPSYSEDQATLSIMREEMKALVDAMQERGGRLVMCVDDPTLADLATAPLTHRFGRSALVVHGDRPHLQVNGRDYLLAREVVGESSLYALAASVIVAQLLDVDESSIERFLVS